MKLITPLDYWRAGFEFWLAAWQAQLALNDRMLLALGPARQSEAGAEAAELTLPHRTAA
jgi:hypothetical protein